MSILPVSLVGRPESSRRWTAAIRAVDPKVWLLTLLFVLVSTGWALAVPLFHPPDEPMHVDLIDALTNDPTYPGYADRRLDRDLSTFSWSYLQAGGASRRPQLGNLDQPPGTDELSLVPGGSGPSAQVDQMPQHPPLYYESMAVALRIARAVHPGDRYPTIAVEVLLLRLLDVAIVAPLPLLTWLAAREAGASERVALSASALLLAVPQLTHIVGSVNNDNLLTVLGAALTLLVLRLLRHPFRWWTDAGIGLVLGAALLTKAFAFVLVPWIVLAYVIAARRQRSWGRGARGVALAGLLSAAASGWFWLRNLHRYGQVAPTVFFERASLRPHGEPVDHLTWVRQFVELLPQRFWGSMGRYAARLPLPVVAVTTVLVVACVVSALAGRPQRDGPDRTALALALLPTLLIGGYVAQHAHHIYVVTGWFSFIQGRYLFAGIAGLAVVAAAGADRIGRGRLGPGHALVCALVLQALAGYVLLDAVWGGAGVSLIDAATTMVVWSPLPGPLVLVVGIALVGVAAASLCSLARAGADARDPGVVARAQTAVDL